MSRPKMPLEELGLLCLLEKVGSTDADMDAYARHGLLRDGLITSGEPPALTEAGLARIEELRKWRDEGELDLEGEGGLLP